MKNILLAAIISAFLCTSGAFASQSLTFIGGSSVASVANYPGALSPYSGTLNGQNVTLYCDDYDHRIGSSYYPASVNVTALNSITSSTTTVRWAGSNPVSGMPTGTTIYQEVAWLDTQMNNYIGNGKTYNATWDAIQEAVWGLTSSNVQYTANSSTTFKNTSLSTAANVSTLNSYYWQWLAANHIGDASGSQTTVANVYGAGAGGAQGTLSLKGANYANWEVIDQATSLSSGNQFQELLTQINPVQNAPTTTPEPGSFALLGGGVLMVASLIRKRRRA